MSKTGLLDNSSMVLESWLVQSEISGKKHNMGLVATGLPDVTHCALWPNLKIEVTEILNRGDLDRPECLIQAQEYPNNTPITLFRIMAAVSGKLLLRQFEDAPEAYF
jgi:hypothetical protein